MTIKKHPFKNVALLPEDHSVLSQIAASEQRTMTRQLSVIIRKYKSHLKKIDNDYDFGIDKNSNIKNLKEKNNQDQVIVIYDYINESGSAFGTTKNGDQVFINSRIVRKINLKIDGTYEGVIISNYEDKRNRVPYRAIELYPLKGRASDYLQKTLKLQNSKVCNF